MTALSSCTDAAVSQPPVRPPVLTFDLEEWFHLLDCDAIPGAEAWGDLPSRIEANTDRLLALLDNHGVKATFFTLGWVARNYPSLLRAIAGQGHELGCHSDIHTLVWSLTPGTFREDTIRALESIRDATGQPVPYYRAPGFSITGNSLWAFDVLLDVGITVDSSVFPGTHAHGGTRTLFPATPFRLESGGRILREYPVSVAGTGPLKLAFVGGGYFRLLPLPLISACTRRHPGAMTYFHPRDFDPGQPRIPGLGQARRFKAYVGLGSAAAKLDAFLRAFGGQPLGEAVAALDWTAVARVSL